MPTYRVTDPTTGKTIRLTGDSPPSEQELAQIFASMGASSQPSAPAQAPPTTGATPTPARTWGDTASDVAMGAAKGLGNTVYGLGKIVHDYTPVGRISDAIQPGAFDAANKPPELTPTTTPQRIGYGLEQIGEFFLPTGVAGTAAKAANIGKAGLLTLAQSGSPTAAGVSAGLTAVLPGASAMQRAGQAVERSAQAEMARALGATKEWAKSESTRLAPELLKRGVGGSRETMLGLAKDTAKRVSGQLDDAYRMAAQAGETVPSDIIAGNIQLAGDALRVARPNGSRVVVPGTESVVQKLDDLAAWVQSMGPEIPVDKAAHIKRTWDQIVSRAGLYGQKSGASATDSANAWAFREAATSFRNLLNTSPTIADLNQEARFWIGLKDVLKETQKRTQAQAGTGLVQAGSSGAGAMIGALSGDSPSDSAMKAILGGVAGRQFVKLIQSPSFRTQVTGPMKQMLADALASQSAGRVASVTSRILAALPSQTVQSGSDTE